MRNVVEAGKTDAVQNLQSNNNTHVWEIGCNSIVEHSKCQAKKSVLNLEGIGTSKGFWTTEYCGLHYFM